jgi:2-desacetyl-2-hydroxyethyl bacteriochlorophyllide A dehydrogenase
MRQARAVWFTAPRQVELRCEDVPRPGRGQVLVRSVVSAISHGTELLVYRGQAPAELEFDLPTFAGSFALPIKYGYATVGEVDEVGPRDEASPRLEPGDRVFVHHPHQSEFVVDASLPVRLPPDLDPERGIFLANLETALNVVLDAHARFGEKVVVFGQGVVGLLVTQLLARSGVSVIAVDGYEQRRRLAERFGATSVAPDELQETAADVTIEISGNPAALQRAIDATAIEGTVVVASWYGTKPVQLQLGGAFHRHRLRLVSSQVSHLDPSLSPRWDRERRTRLAVELLPRLDLAPLITHRFTLGEAAQAYRLLDEQPEQTVQAVFRHV